MRIETSSGYTLRTRGELAVLELELEMQRLANNIEAACRRRQSARTGNVVGGSLDGATMPAGTRDGQQYRWDADAQRWVMA